MNGAADAGVTQNMRRTVTKVERYHSNNAQILKSIIVFIAVTGSVCHGFLFYKGKFLYLRKGFLI